MIITVVAGPTALATDDRNGAVGSTLLPGRVLASRPSGARASSTAVLVSKTIP